MMARSGSNSFTVDGASLLDNNELSQTRGSLSPSPPRATTSGELGELFEYRMSQARHHPARTNPPCCPSFSKHRRSQVGSSILTPVPASTNAAELTTAPARRSTAPHHGYDGGRMRRSAHGTSSKATTSHQLCRRSGHARHRSVRRQGGGDSEIHSNRGRPFHQIGRRGNAHVYRAHVDHKPKTLIIEHPLRQGYTLPQTDAGGEAASAYRF